MSLACEKIVLLEIHSQSLFLDHLLSWRLWKIGNASVLKNPSVTRQVVWRIAVESKIKFIQLRSITDHSQPGRIREAPSSRCSSLRKATIIFTYFSRFTLLKERFSLCKVLHVQNSGFGNIRMLLWLISRSWSPDNWHKFQEMDPRWLLER